MITPFKSDGEVDYEALTRLVEYQIRNGVDFLCIMGTTAETPCLSADEKKILKKMLVERVAGRVPLLMGCGGNNTAAVVKDLKEGDWSGIDGILSVCPYYNKPSQEGLYQHFKAIAEASPVPVVLYNVPGRTGDRKSTRLNSSHVLYNVPGRTGVNMSAETTLRLARDFENIVAVKEASGNMTQLEDVIKNKPRDFDVLSGDDGITYPLITMGAVGVISVIGNALPAEFSRMVRMALNGDYEHARIIHHKFSDLFKLLFVDGNPAGVKAMLHAMGMIENQLRLPLVPTRLTTMEKISSILKELDIRY